MTDTKTRLSLAGVIVAVCLFIFFTPFLLGRTQPNIEAAVQQNMSFLDEMVRKYMAKHNNRPPDSMNALLQDARTQNYNKTLFNPLMMNGGDVNNEFIVVKYKPAVFASINKDFKDTEYAGKTGYFSDGKSYAIYGHIQEGRLLKQDGKVLLYGNFSLPASR